VNAIVQPPAPAAESVRPRTLRIGPLPWPVYLGAVLVTAIACYWDRLPADIIGGLSVLMLGGFLLGKLGQTIVTACHSGLGGTGDVAILSAADRLGLMAFAQISTRVGGAIMIVVATFLLRALTP
jgi:malate:Na+ symporter